MLDASWHLWCCCPFILSTIALTLGTTASLNTHTRTCTFTHDAGRKVAPLVLLSIHPSYYRTEHLCTPTHAHIDTDREDRGGSDALSSFLGLGSCVSINLLDCQAKSTQIHSQLCCLQGRRYREITHTRAHAHAHQVREREARMRARTLAWTACCEGFFVDIP